VSARLFAIDAFRLTSAEPERLAHFYRGLGFAIGARQTIPDDEIALLGLTGSGTRLPLRLGEQRVDLDCFDQRGCAYPSTATSADLCFQHFALVTDNASTLWSLARMLGAAPISTNGPVTLPASAGGVTAVKFRDPEGHPLEALQFPSDRGDHWQGNGLLGIDHSAINVSDVGTSSRFYEALGLSVQTPTQNQGSTQEALDGLSPVVVDVVPIMPRRQTPHLELLAYRSPAGRPAGVMKPNDVAATRIVWRADCDAFICDPDNHLHLLQRASHDRRRRAQRERIAVDRSV
jgi:catechol 2,3-dioxygenase-like lactoylglutathione lyase family enzyme